MNVARQALAVCKKARDIRGEAACLQALARARRANSEGDSAMAAARRAQGLLKDLGDSINQVKCLQLIASVQFDKGYWELCLKAAKQALKLLAGAGEEDAKKLARDLETLIAYAHQARGEEPPLSSRRSEALQVVQELGKALQERSAAKFGEVLARLRPLGAFTASDTNRAFAPELERDPDGAASFLAENMSASDVAAPGVGGSTALVASDYYQGWDWSQPDICCLRTFPSPVDRQTGKLEAPDGQAELSWYQSAGQITLCHVLRDGPRTEVPGGWTEEDVAVELSQDRLRVTLGGQPVKWLTGEFYEDIWRKDSWWMLEQDEETRLVIKLYKRIMRTWPAPWHASNTTFPTSRHRTAFPWTKQMREFDDSHFNGNSWDPILEEVPKESEIEAIPGGAPEPEEDEPAANGGYLRSTPGDVFAPPSERFICRPEDLCLGISAEQDNNFITIQIHFERGAFQRFRQRNPLEKLLAADVWHNAVCIFFQGDKQNPILWGELSGHCLPYQTTWRITSSEPMRKRQDNSALFSPCLEIKIGKADHSKGEWPAIFGQCVQARLMAKTWEPGQPRFEGLSSAITARRAGYDLQDPDFWSLVDNYAHETMKKTGHSTAPRKLVAA